ncbi:LppP/LprE family lipoprotein [Curtobacterium sp. NPDC098951]|uniref:LppP/LprE family lipoprotein n=1 Tax=Curtobacterium sp. NPDC098951 TaxID=3363974 RepID=UPI00382C805F
MRTLHTTGGILFAAVLAVVLAGCSGGEDADPTATTTRTVTATPTAVAESPSSPPSSTPTPTPTCGPSSGAEAAAGPIADLPLPAGLEDARWDAANADTAGYDACAALSWVTVSVERATGSSPVAILLFHDGRYLGTATKEQYGFVPDISRTDASTIAVTYHYAKPDETTAEESGRTNATFRWDEAAGRVVMTGQTPPEG